MDPRLSRRSEPEKDPAELVSVITSEYGNRKKFCISFCLSYD